MFSYKTNFPKQTQKVAADLAERFLKKRGQKNALVFALKGDLGSGKTTFTQGFLRALGVKKKITSPTFVIFKRFKIYNLRFKNVYHFDCYRIRTAKELLNLGFKEILKNPQNMVLIEWPEKVRRVLPKNTIWLKFEHGEKENIRNIEISHKSLTR